MEQPLIDPAKVVTGIAADSLDNRVNDGSQPAQASDQLFSIVAVRLTNDMVGPHVQELLASFHKHSIEVG